MMRKNALIAVLAVLPIRVSGISVSDYPFCATVPEISLVPQTELSEMRTIDVHSGR